MSKDIGAIPRVAIFLAGIVAGAIVNRRRETPVAESPRIDELKQSIQKLEGRISVNESAAGVRFEAIEARIDSHAETLVAHEAKLAEMPTTSQIVGAMEQLLTKTMASLDDRLTAQAQSIELLKTTVSQTDNLLERVLESLDSLQTFGDATELAQDPVLHRPAV